MMKSAISFVFLGIVLAVAAPVADKSSWDAGIDEAAMVVGRVENGYVAADIDLDGYDGNFQEGGDLTGAGSYLKLTYGWPGTGTTEWILFYVDGITAKTNGTTMPASDVHYAEGGSLAVVQWDNWNGVMIRLEYRPMSLGASPGEIEQIQYKIVMKPVDGAGHNCGAMIFWDTMINGNDGAPISTSYGYSASAQIFYAPDIPSIWRAYENTFPPAPGDMQALGILSGFEATMPDVFWYGSWPDGVGLGWNTSAWAAATGSGYTDSATMVKWNERFIAPGDSVVFISYYGIGNFSTVNVVVNHNPPTISPDCDGTMNPDTTRFSFLIVNGGTDSLCHATATLSGPGFIFLTGDSVINIGTIAGYGGSYLAEWGVQFDSTVWGTTQNYVFILHFDDCAGHDSTIVDTYSVYIPHPSNIYVHITSDDSVMCAGDTTQLHAEFGGYYGGATYMWSPTYGLSDPMSPDPLAFPEVTTTYTFTVTDSNGCVGVDYITVFIDQLYAEAGSDVSVCLGDSVMIGGIPTASGGTPPFEYVWTPAAGLSDPSAPNPYAHPETTTTYYVEITDAAGCYAIDSVTVTVSLPPYAYFVLPDTCGLVTSCNPPQFQLVVADPDSTVDPTSFVAYINGARYDGASGVFDYTDTILTITPPDAFHTGDTVEVQLVDYRDFQGCSGDTVSCYVIVDADPPYAIMTDPTPGSSILNPSPTVTIEVSDSPAGVDTASFNYISVYVNGTPVDTFTVNWSDPNLTISGFTAAEGGTVTVCLDSLWDTPDYPYCPPNDTSYCWSFVIVTGNVVAYPVEPTDMQSTACEDQRIIIKLFGSVNPVDTNSIELYIDGVLHTLDSAYLSYNPGDSTLTFDLLGGSWPDADTICVDLWATDIYGAPMDDTLHFCFITDFSPPYLTATTPADGDTVYTLAPSFSFSITDDITGVAFVMATVDDSIILTPADSCVSFDGTNFSFDAECAGIYYPPNEDVQVCVHSWDSPDLCDPNEMDTCWTFVVAMVCSLVADAGPDTEICVGSSVTLGGDPVAYNGTPPYSYQWTSTDGSFSSTEEHPTVSPDAPTTYVLMVTDSLGCVAYDTVFVNAHNCAGPSAVVVRPTDGTWSSCDSEYIEITINDPDGVVDSSIVLRVNGTDYTVDSPQVSWSEPTLIFVPSAPFADGETVYVDLLSADDVFGNPLEGAPISWRFYIDRTPPSMWGETPAPDEVISSPHFAFSCRIDDEGSGLDTNSIQLFVGDSAFVYGDPCLTVEPGPGDAFTLISVDSLCLPTPPCDTITIRLVATDTTDYCEDNILDTSWTIYTDCEPPSATIVFPAESVWYSCPEESVVVTLLDDAPGVDTTTIALSAMGDGGYMESAVWGDPGLSYDFGTGTLVWHPATPFPDAGNVVITVGASDLLGNAMPRLSWIIFMDRIPPEVAAISPECDEVVATVHPDIYIVATDSGCGEITPSVTINGTDYSDFEFAGDTIRVSPSAVPVFSGGDTVTVCWHLTDCAGDVCEPNATDTCCTFSVAAGGPVANIHNPADSAFVACTDFEVHITIADPDGIIADSVALGAVIDGTLSTFGLSDPSVSYTEYDDSIVVVWTPPASDGQQVEIYVASAYDSLFNRLSYSDDVVFVFDFSPPEFSGMTPAGGSVVDETAPAICVDVSDDGSGVDWSAVGFVIDGATYGASSPAVSVDPATGQMCFDPTAAGISWYGGDTVDVCAFAQDSPDTCGPNADTTCWSFSIATGGPTVEVITPGDGVVDACEPDSVVWTAYDPNGIEPSSLGLIFVAGGDTTVFTESSAGVNIVLSAGGDSVTISLQIPGDVPDGETIIACLVALTDSLGNPAGTTCVQFEIDRNPPYVEIISPGDGEVVHSTQPEIVAVVSDSGSGIDTSALEIFINGILYTLADPCVEFAADTLIFDPAGCGVVWYGGDTITVCLHAPDLADTDFCGPNVADTCWSFVVAADPPTTEIIRPLDSTVSSCDPETVKIAISDPDGVADTSIALTLNGDTLRVGDPEVSFDGETLRVIIADSLPEGWFEVCLVSVSDMLGNPIPAPVCFSFLLDRIPPFMVATVPEESTLTSNTSQDVAVALWDNFAGVDTSSVVLEVNGTAVAHENLTWSFEGDTVWVRYSPASADARFVPGDTVEIRIFASDSTDYCDDNFLDTSFVFFIEPEVGCMVRPNPFTPNRDGVNDFAVFNYPGMFSKSGKLEVFDIRGAKVYEGEIGPVSGFDDVASRRWDGTDTQGNPLEPGLYMYVIIVDGEVVCSGTVVLAR